MKNLLINIEQFFNFSLDATSREKEKRETNRKAHLERVFKAGQGIGE